ncbi:hypothetical protein GCM10027598_31220 [Amycolatopsis oliviviridis]|uniref:Uncharacterized protein n=1 Tax=Amycolatopsis oliviviridis TaxID=1471590 RepID=A0ABQ3LRX9_9PSEU|nr:hypothetical protein [Amycolatopsis oliviviridis]GHH24509.1 hypothetical protein GCM10017790_48940 [Amycolatopsis oliviviridis]
MPRQAAAWYAITSSFPARINFDNGVLVGGWANLTVYPNGNYNFSGHFHDSGATSYNVGIVMAIRNPVTDTAHGPGNGGGPGGGAPAAAAFLRKYPTNPPGSVG